MAQNSGSLAAVSKKMCHATRSTVHVHAQLRRSLTDSRIRNSVIVEFGSKYVTKCNTKDRCTASPCRYITLWNTCQLSD